jgi:hypothetical protein
MELLEPEILPFFFGSHFDIRVAMKAVNEFGDVERLKESVVASIDQGVPHVGMQIIGYENIDTGLSVVALRAKQNSPSMISFFAESAHRVFGGSTLVCVPLQFCSPYYKREGNYLVYRHTFKRRKLTEQQYEEIMSSGNDQQKMAAFLESRTRDGYETIPGKSYVGISSRPWQERYDEHAESALKKGSSTRFHEAIREMQGQKVVHVHDISAFGLTESQAKTYESDLIRRSTLWPLGLNMRT